MHLKKTEVLFQIITHNKTFPPKKQNVESWQRSSINSVKFDTSTFSYLSIFVFRVCAPPGGRSNNIFGPTDQEQAAINKKNHTGSDIFGVKKG